MYTHVSPRRPKELLLKFVEKYFPVPKPPAGARGRGGRAAVDSDDEEEEWSSDEDEGREGDSSSEEEVSGPRAPGVRGRTRELMLLTLFCYT
jgi:ribosomal protein L12E/L44/L45/RPP1/RPP2